MKIERSYSHIVRYSETDQMGFLHHSNYARIYENARWELFRNLGISYKQIEEDGILMPVVEMNAKFIKPLKYDDEVEVVTIIKESPTAKLKFDVYFLSKEQGLTHQAEIVLAFISKITLKACRPTNQIIEALNTYLVNP